MPTDEAQRNRNNEFLRGGNTPANPTASQRAGGGRLFEQQGDVQGGGANPVGSKQEYPQPQRPTIRATLVERDNEDEYLEFHWNPSSYRIGKSAKWDEKPVAKGHPTIEFAGTGLTKVTFEALFNNIAQPHAIQLSVENSLQWLFDRLRARSDPLRVSPQTAPRDLPWMNLQDPKATLAPPVLVLFGVSRPFTCVLTDVQVTTIFQGQNANGSSIVRSQSANITNFGSGQSAQQVFGRTSGGQAIENLRDDGTLSAAINLANELDKISRASVQITLKEYVNDPSTESK